MKLWKNDKVTIAESSMFIYILALPGTYLTHMGGEGQMWVKHLAQGCNHKQGLNTGPLIHVWGSQDHSYESQEPLPLQVSLKLQFPSKWNFAPGGLK